MKTKIAKNITYWLGIVVIGLVVGLSIQFVTAWTEPSSNPPGGNLGAPINTGNVGQDKKGNLAINTLNTWLNGLLVYGKVGFNTLTPGSNHSTYDPVSGNSQVGLDVNNQIITGVKTPVDGSDAVNKDYVIANSGGGGIGTCYNSADMLFIQFISISGNCDSVGSGWSQCTLSQIKTAGDKGCLPIVNQYRSADSASATLSGRLTDGSNICAGWTINCGLAPNYKACCKLGI